MPFWILPLPRIALQFFQTEYSPQAQDSFLNRLDENDFLMQLHLHVRISVSQVRNKYFIIGVFTKYQSLH